MPRPFALAAAGVLLLAAALRFPTLGTQSFWLDEVATARLVERDLGGVFSGVWDGESTPPLYYLLAWLWAKVLGTGEAGLRALSALMGTATVGVALALGHRLGGARAAVLAGLLAACSPLLVWYSQEARAYALLVLLGALSVLLALRADAEPTPGRLGAWGVVAACALASHYFAAFLLLPQAVWLVARAGLRRTVPALLIPAVAVAALAPLALNQNANDTAAFIRASSLPVRTAQVGKQWLAGFDAPAERLLTAAAGLLVLAGLGMLLRRLLGDRGTRRPLLLVAAAVAVSLLLPLLLALLGEDNVLTRNLLAALVPALALVGVGYAAGRLAGTLAAIALAGLWTAALVSVATDPALQRDDWRGAVRAAGDGPGPRAVVVTPASGRLPAGHYLGGGARAVAGGHVRVSEVALVGIADRRPGEPRAAPPAAPAEPPAPGFAIAGRVETPAYTVVRYRAAAPVQIPAEALAARGLGGTPGAVLVVAPG